MGFEQKMEMNDLFLLEMEMETFEVTTTFSAQRCKFHRIGPTSKSHLKSQIFPQKIKVQGNACTYYLNK